MTAVIAVSMALVIVTGMRPDYDAFGWLVWGKQVLGVIGRFRGLDALPMQLAALVGVGLAVRRSPAPTPSRSIG